MSRQQRLTTWMAAITVMIGSLGVPLSSQRAPRSGAAFPCQDCVCGCPDAETCWRDCCCFTNSQKIVWAEKNGVKVPLYVTVAARREQVKVAKPDCCREQASNCESSAQLSSEGSICSEDSADSCTSSSCCAKKSHDSSESSSKTVLLITALKCRGISVSVGLLPPSVPPAEAAVDSVLVDLGPLPGDFEEFYLSPSDDVATPPPDACEFFAS